MIIKILGSGCKKCNDLYKNSESAVKELEIDAEIEKITDMVEIMKFGVMSTPALVVNDEVKSAGTLLSSKEIVDILSKI